MQPGIINPSFDLPPIALPIVDLVGAEHGYRSALSNLLRSDGATVADYDMSLGVTGTTNASAVANQIGAAGPLLQATGANQPQIVGDGSLLFDGLAHFMDAAFAFSGAKSIYAVIIPVTWTANDYLFDGKSVNSGALLDLTAAGTPKVSYANNAVNYLTAQTFTLGTKDTVTAIANGANSVLRIGSGTGVTGDAGANANMAGFSLGRPGSTNAFYSNIQVYRVILRTVADDAAKQAQIQSLLKAIYGTP